MSGVLDDVFKYLNVPPSRVRDNRASRFDIEEAIKEAEAQMASVSGVALAGPANYPGASGGTPNRNYEAAIFSRLSVSGVPHRFDLVKVHRSRDGSKYFVFVVVENRWVVLEDGAMFPSDDLITALRCLQF